MQKSSYNWLPDFVYGGIDGAITTFAVVAGVEGANLSPGIILVLGFANLLADGFSMAVGKYMSDRSEMERQQHLRQVEERSIVEKPKEEKKEVREILVSLGFQGEDLERAHRVITSNPDSWVKIMMHHELNIIEENLNPKKGALATFLAFTVMGVIPLISYVLQRFLDWNIEYTFIGTSFATLLALFLVGTVKSRFSDRHWFFAGLETALVGGVAASLAFGVGYGLQALLA